MANQPVGNDIWIAIAWCIAIICVAYLFALLSLGIKGIYLGPTLPAFLSPNVLQYLVDIFDIRTISEPDDDLKSCLQQGI